MSKIKSIEDVNSALSILGGMDPDLEKARAYVTDSGSSVPLRLRPGGFRGLAEIVVSQLVSKASASAINARMLEQISPFDPESCLKASDDLWRKIGMSRAKQATLCAVATAIQNQSLQLDKLEHLPIDNAMSHLTAIKGIGPWTAEVYLLFCVGHPDIFPSGDLALREAARLIWNEEERPSSDQLRKKVQKWSPHRGTAARLLWAYYAAKKCGKDAMP